MVFIFGSSINLDWIIYILFHRAWVGLGHTSRSNLEKQLPVDVFNFTQVTTMTKWEALFWLSLLCSAHTLTS